VLWLRPVRLQDALREGDPHVPASDDGYTLVVHADPLLDASTLTLVFNYNRTESVIPSESTGTATLGG